LIVIVAVVLPGSATGFDPFGVDAKFAVLTKFSV
jgi:hypothetical protein